MLALGAVSATLSILVLGWLTVSFQLFGESPSRGDHLEAAGLYDAGAALMLVASIACVGVPRTALADVVVLDLHGVVRAPRTGCAPELGRP